MKRVFTLWPPEPRADRLRSNGAPLIYKLLRIHLSIQQLSHGQVTQNRRVYFSQQYVLVFEPVTDEAYCYLVYFVA